MSYAKHFLSIRDLSKERIVGLIADAENFSKYVGDYPAVLESKLLASAFFEPSLRTQLSFEAAMVRLGGKVLGMGSPNGSRANSAHEESLADSAKVVSGYADVIVFRHSAPGALKLYTEYSSVPVINAGNGNGPDSEHPSQALCDLYTIKKHFGKIDGLTVALLGSLQKRAILSDSRPESVPRYHNRLPAVDVCRVAGGRSAVSRSIQPPHSNRRNRRRRDQNMRCDLPRWALRRLAAAAR